MMAAHANSAAIIGGTSFMKISIWLVVVRQSLQTPRQGSLSPGCR
jgi:type III secretory pathway component EscR